MLARDNLLLDLLYCQQQAQNDMAYRVQVIHQSQRDHTNDSLIDDTPTCDGEPESYFNCILKLVTIAAVTK